MRTASATGMRAALSAGNFFEDLLAIDQEQAVSMQSEPR